CRHDIPPPFCVFKLNLLMGYFTEGGAFRFRTKVGFIHTIINLEDQNDPTNLDNSHNRAMDLHNRRYSDVCGSLLHGEI
ncbi:MAG: hypothetical protein UW16_C0012G0001, partial [Microgenomates group bacterium GW2011_GWC1_44_10]